MRISDWSSDVCSSDLCHARLVGNGEHPHPAPEETQGVHRIEGLRAAANLHDRQFRARSPGRRGPRAQRASAQAIARKHRSPEPGDDGGCCVADPAANTASPCELPAVRSSLRIAVQCSWVAAGDVARNLVDDLPGAVRLAAGGAVGLRPVVPDRRRRLVLAAVAAVRCLERPFRGDGIALAIACPGDRLPVAGIFHSLIHAEGVGTVHAAADLAADDESDDGAGRNGCQAAPAVADLRAGCRARRAAQQFADDFPIAPADAEVDRRSREAVVAILVTPVAVRRRPGRRSTRMTRVAGAFVLFLVAAAIALPLVFAVARLPLVFLLAGALVVLVLRSEEHTSELKALMRISYAVFCLKKKNTAHNAE